MEATCIRTGGTTLGERELQRCGSLFLWFPGAGAVRRGARRLAGKPRVKPNKPESSRNSMGRNLQPRQCLNVAKFRNFLSKRKVFP